MADAPSFVEALQRYVDSRLLSLHTALPCKVESYDETTQTVSVQPQIKTVLIDPDDGRKLEEALPKLSNIPVMFPRGGGAFVSLPLAAGDTVLVVFCESSLDNWRATEAPGVPAEAGRHTLAGAVAIPGLYGSKSPLAEASSTAFVAGRDGGSQLRIADDDAVQIGATGATYQPVAVAGDVLAQLNALQSSLNAFITIFNAHVHVPGNPTVTPGIPAGAPTEVGSAVVEVQV